MDAMCVIVSLEEAIPIIRDLVRHVEHENLVCEVFCSACNYKSAHEDDCVYMAAKRFLGKVDGYSDTPSRSVN